MFEIQNYNGFILAVLLFQLYTGSGTIAILNATARGGVCGGMKVVFGTITGDFIYMLSAVLGLVAILSAYPSLLNIAQWIGVIYLIWIGFNFIIAQKNRLKNIENGDWAFYRKLNLLGQYPNN